MTAVLQIDPHGSRPFVPSSPSNGIESARENYTAKNPQDPLYGMSQNDIKYKRKIDLIFRRCSLL
jgi:hypothetical protein